MSLLHLTLQKSGRQMLGFSLMAAFVFFAFTALFYLIFHSQLRQFSTWVDTSQTCFEMISLHFSTVKELKRADPLIAGLCLFLFIFLAVFLLGSMFVSIIVDNFKLIRQQELKRDNEVELIQFTIGKLRHWLGKDLYYKSNK
jgi:predicted PurR-regulated permease PerM